MSERTASLLKPIAALTDEELRAAKALLRTSSERSERPRDELLLESFADIEPEPLFWLWQGVIPLGKLTLLIGDPGLGKSLVALDIVSRISRGAPWPDGSPCQMGRSLVLSAEDDPSDTIRPRLDAAGALPQMVELVRVVFDEEGKRRGFRLGEDVSKLDEALGRAGAHFENARLLLVDPLSAYLGDVDSHKNSEVREVLAPLAELAARRKVAVLGIAHLNKSSGPAIYRASGSLAFVAAARAVWAIGKDAEDEGRRLMLPVKMNLAENCGGFAYRIESTDNVPRISWERGKFLFDADRLLTVEEPREAAEWREAADWLRERLSRGPVSAKEIQADATANGITRKPLYEASKRLGVSKSKGGFSGGWTWALPGPTASDFLEDSRGFGVPWRPEEAEK